MDKKIEEGELNEIGKFMGWRFIKWCKGDLPMYQRFNDEGEVIHPGIFHSPDFDDWNSLMPVVEKIAKTIIPKAWLNAGWDLNIFYSINSVCTSFEIGDHDLHITDSGINPKSWNNTTLSSLERTYMAVIQFLTWYNNQSIHLNKS